MLGKRVRPSWAIAFSLAVSLCRGEAVSTLQESLEKARTAQQQGDYPAAERYFRLALKSQPRSAELWNGLGVVLNREERYDDAAEAFRKASALMPSVEGIQLNLGIALFRAGKLNDAAPVFEKLPNSQQARELLAMTYAGLGKCEHALPQLEELAPPSTDPTLHIALAQCYERLDRKADVEKAMARMLQVVPEGAPLHLALADAYDQAANPEGALAEYRKAAELDPKLPGVAFRMGRMLWKARRFDEAQPALEAELKNDPGNVDAKFYLASIYLYRDNDARRAIPLLEEFTRVRTNEKNGYFELGRALLKENQAAKAAAALEKAAALSPDEPNVHYILAQALRSAGRTADATREFDISKRLRAAQFDDLNKKFQNETGKQASSKK